MRVKGGDELPGVFIDIREQAPPSDWRLFHLSSHSNEAGSVASYWKPIPIMENVADISKMRDQLKFQT